MRSVIARAQAEHIELIAFGDLFLEDIRAYREKQMEGTGIQPVFPIWGRDTGELAHEMVNSGLKAKLVCIDPRHLEASFAGREFDADLLRELPSAVDPCGERGEFHTAVYAGPMFQRVLSLTPGEIVHRDGFIYSDFLPESRIGVA